MGATWRPVLFRPGELGACTLGLSDEGSKCVLLSSLTSAVQSDSEKLTFADVVEEEITDAQDQDRCMRYSLGTRRLLLFRRALGIRRSLMVLGTVQILLQNLNGFFWLGALRTSCGRYSASGPRRR